MISVVSVTFVFNVMSTFVILVIEAFLVAGLILIKGVISDTCVISFINMKLLPGVILVSYMTMFVRNIEC